MKRSVSLESRIARLQTYIGQGQQLLAQNELREILSASRVPRKDLLKLAIIARKAHLSELAIRILRPVVRPSTRKKADGGTPHERIEYAANLISIGAVLEAIKILEAIDAGAFPDTLLYRAYSHFRQWDWARAQPLLERAKAMQDSGRSLIAEPTDLKLTMAAAKIFGTFEHEDAQRLLDEVAIEAEANGNRVRMLDALQLSAQNQWHLKNWEKCLSFLKRLEGASHGQESPFYSALAREFRTLIEIERKGPAPERLRAIDEVVAVFKSQSHWEHARGADFYAARVLRDRDRLIRQYFGTRHPALRRRVLEVLGIQESELPQSYVFGSTRPGARILDISNGTIPERSCSLKEGQLLQRTLQALTCDQFRPQGIAELHERLYTGLYFDPISSTAKIQRAVQRLRDWLAASRIPLEIICENGRYRAEPGEGLAIRVYRAWTGERPAAPLRLRKLVQALAAAYGDKEFSASDAERKWRTSSRSAVRHLLSATKLGLLERSGAGPSTRYRVR